MEENIVSISLFSGAGGLDIASHMAGVPVASSTDFDSDCIKTLKANAEYFGNTEIFEGDLHQIESSVFSDVIKKRGARKFIVIGGAPCQPFSKAGYWVGNETRRGINDPRATLVDEYLRVVADINPDGFVFENVESLLHPTNKIIVERFIEIIEEAVEAAIKNSKLNNIDNCEFIAGDVLKKIDEINEKPDLIVVDPPRDGIHPKAITKIIDFGANEIVYVSCKPTSLVRDLQIFEEHGYKTKKVVCVNQFPRTNHCESVVLLSKNN